MRIAIGARRVARSHGARRACAKRSACCVPRCPAPRHSRFSALVDGRMKQEQLAINSVSTRHKDLEEALAAYDGAGFRQVELLLPHVKDWLAAGHTVDDVRRLLAAHNLRAIGGFETFVAC